jgi:signal peptidase II
VQKVFAAFSRWALPAIVLLACIGCDQWTKRIAAEHLKHSPPLAPLSFLGDTLRIQYAENPGAFLGAGANLSENARFWILIVVNAIFLVLIGTVVATRRVSGRWQTLAVALLIAGGIGNLIDRVFHAGLVVDFLNLGVGALRTGIFNVADMAIMAGFFLLILIRSPGPPASESAPLLPPAG